MKSLLLLSGLLFVHIGMLSLFSTVKADENVSGKSPEELPESMVYFIGSVEQVLESRAIFDLGDAHSLREGDVVTVFRSRDNEYQPLGTLEVRESFPTWSVSLPTKKFVAETGDIVVFVRAVGEIGTPRAIQARFLADQKISNRNRNSYSTVRNDVVARALTKVQRGQPGWVQFRKTISGTVYSESLGSNPSSNLRRLTDQIDLLRMLDQSGLPASDAASDRWMIVMKQLSTRSAKSESVVVQEADNAAANFRFVMFERLLKTASSKAIRNSRPWRRHWSLRCCDMNNGMRRRGLNGTFG
ncbi:MAG: hypothetical protein R3C20_16840 [Planctomycetaceae bacterium]